jgi:hypothetical protein
LVRGAGASNVLPEATGPTIAILATGQAGEATPS